MYFQGWKRRSSGMLTRSSSRKILMVEKPNSTRYQKSVSDLGPKLWNSMPKELQKLDDYSIFEFPLKNQLDKHRVDGLTNT